MITERTHEQPAARSGYRCQGSVTTDEGIGSFSIKGRDNSARITGITLIPFAEAELGTAYLPQVSIISYSSSTRLTTVVFLVQKIVHTASDNNVISVTDVDIPVFYSCWIDDEPEGLPADLSTNDTENQSY